jgi:hypothetical protein
VGDDLVRVLDHFPALKDKVSREASALSGGEQQMVAIGRGMLGGGVQVVGEGMANFHTVVQELTVGTTGSPSHDVLLAAVQNNDTKAHTIGIFATCAFVS